MQTETVKYLVQSTVLLTLTNKLDEECDVVIKYERSYNEDGLDTYTCINQFISSRQ